MKVTVERKHFIEYLDKYITRGKRRVKAALGNIVGKTIVKAFDNRLILHGCGESFVIYANINMEAQVEEEGSFMIDNPASMLANIKKFRGKELTIESNDQVINYVSETTRMTDPVEEILRELELQDWEEIYNLEDDSVTITVDEQVGKFTRWFTIAGVFLKDIADICLNTVESDVVNISTKEGKLTIQSSNQDTKREYNTTFDLEQSVDASFQIEYIFPILSKLGKETIFYYYVTKSGRLRIIVHDGNNWWMCRYDKKTN